VAAGAALQKDAVVGDAQQVVVTTKAAETFVHPCGKRPQYGRGLMTVGSGTACTCIVAKFFERSRY
jgi:hypothetical protein